MIEFCEHGDETVARRKIYCEDSEHALWEDAGIIADTLEEGFLSGSVNEEGCGSKQIPHSETREYSIDQFAEGSDKSFLHRRLLICSKESEDLLRTYKVKSAWSVTFLGQESPQFVSWYTIVFDEAGVFIEAKIEETDLSSDFEGIVVRPMTAYDYVVLYNELADFHSVHSQREDSRKSQH